jgi:hypothetical protein
MLAGVAAALPPQADKASNDKAIKSQDILGRHFIPNLQFNKFDQVRTILRIGSFIITESISAERHQICQGPALWLRGWKPVRRWYVQAVRILTM